jgi:5-methylcytosine-specific restriction endonuclease McrA
MSIEGLKRCNKCGETKGIDEFARDRARLDGHQAYCKDCRGKYNRKYYEANRESILEQKREYHEENREKRLEYNRKYYEANRERFLANAHQHRQANPEYAREHYEGNREKYREHNREYCRQNREKVRTMRSNYRARLANAEGSHTEHEWLEVVWRQGFACAHCDGIKPLHRDHIMPLSKGGSNYISNIQGLCLSCNSRKKDKMPNGEKATG